VDGYAEVSVVMKDGSRYEERVDHPKGSPQAPLTWEELVAKFRDCASRALAAEAAERVVALVRRIEALANVRELTEALMAAEARASPA